MRLNNNYSTPLILSTIIGYNGSCSLAVQHGHNTKVHRQTGSQRQQYHKSPLLIFCELFPEKSCEQISLSCFSYFWCVMRRTIAKCLDRRNSSFHFCRFPAGKKDGNSNTRLVMHLRFTVKSCKNLCLPLWCNPFSIKAAPKTPYPDFFKEKQIAWFKS